MISFWISVVPPKMDEQTACRRDAVSWCGTARPTAGCTVAQRSTAQQLVTEPLQDCDGEAG